MNSLLPTCLHAHHRHLRHLHPLVHHSHMALCRSLNLTLELLTPVVSHNLPCLAFALLWTQFMLSTSKKRKTWKCVYNCLFQLRPPLQESRSGAPVQRSLHLQCDRCLVCPLGIARGCAAKLKPIVETDPSQNANSDVSSVSLTSLKGSPNLDTHGKHDS